MSLSTTRRRLLQLCVVSIAVISAISFAYFLPDSLKDDKQQTQAVDSSGGYMWERMDLSPEMREAYEEITGKDGEEYRFRGSVKDMEDFMRVRELTRREMGMQVPAMPFRDRFAGLKDRIEAQGHDPDSLYDAFQALSDSTDAIAGSPSLSMQLEREAPRTAALQGMFDRNDREGVTAFVEERLDADARDLPALLVRLDLAISDAAVDEVFDNLERLVDAVAGFQPKAVESGAIHYYLLLNGNEYAYLANEDIQERVEKMRQWDGLLFSSMRILYALEREGEW